MWRDVKDVYCQFVFYFEGLLLALDGWQQKFSGFAYIHRPDKIFNCLEVLQGALECPGWKEIVAGCCSWCMYALTSAEISSFSSNGLCSYCCNWAFFVTRAQEKQTHSQNAGEMDEWGGEAAGRRGTQCCMLQMVHPGEPVHLRRAGEAPTHLRVAASVAKCCWAKPGQRSQVRQLYQFQPELVPAHACTKGVTFRADFGGPTDSFSWN